ncbi:MULTISPECIES: hypothetical protein [unclassified Providencia]|uniref:hypothetical protein n=1 Tax=unclassified Providencia TaxID=2633465 RepID=UPI003C2CAE4A
MKEKEINLEGKKDSLEKAIIGIMFFCVAIGCFLFIFGKASAADSVIAASTAGLFMTALLTLYIVFIERIERLHSK